MKVTNFTRTDCRVNGLCVHLLDLRQKYSCECGGILFLTSDDDGEWMVACATCGTINAVTPTNEAEREAHAAQGILDLMPEAIRQQYQQNRRR